MISLTVRPAIVPDIAILAEYWYDQMALLTQKTPAIRLQPQAEAEWCHVAEKRLSQASFDAFVVENAGTVLGGIIGEICDNQPGLLPRQIGVVRDLLIDTHTPNRQANTVSRLLNALQARWREHGITQLIVQVPAHAPVAQAFWRARTTHELTHTFWTEL